MILCDGRYSHTFLHAESAKCARGTLSPGVVWFPDPSTHKIRACACEKEGSGTELLYSAKFSRRIIFAVFADWLRTAKITRRQILFD